MQVFKVASSFFDYAQACTTVDTEIVDIIAQVFLDRYTEEIATLRHAIDIWDVPSTVRYAHDLKAILGHFGATPAVQVAAEMATTASAGNLARTDMLFLPLTMEIELLAECLRTWGPRSGTQCA